MDKRNLNKLLYPIIEEEVKFVNYLGFWGAKVEELKPGKNIEINLITNNVNEKIKNVFDVYGVYLITKTNGDVIISSPKAVIDIVDTAIKIVLRHRHINIDSLIGIVIREVLTEAVVNSMFNKPIINIPKKKVKVYYDKVIESKRIRSMSRNELIKHLLYLFRKKFYNKLDGFCRED